MAKVTRQDVHLQDWVEVEVIQESGPVRWAGQLHPLGTRFKMRHYNAIPAMKAGQVMIVAFLKGYDPAEEKATDLLIDTTPAPTAQAKK